MFTSIYRKKTDTVQSLSFLAKMAMAMQQEETPEESIPKWQMAYYSPHPTCPHSIRNGQDLQSKMKPIGT